MVIDKNIGEWLSKIRSGKFRTDLDSVTVWPPGQEGIALAFQLWDFFRHPLAHGFQQKSSETPEMTFRAFSRLTAAIYILIAARMDYSGKTDVSIIEGASPTTMPPQSN